MSILIVEDEVRIANAIKKVLKIYSHDSDIVNDAQEALRLLIGRTSKSYKLIILDRMLPGVMSGSQLCQHLRKNNIGIPIIFLTALSEVEDRIDGLHMGADDYLMKPFSMAELVARVEALLRRNPLKINSIVKIKDIEIDLVNATIIRSGQPIKLTFREFKLLNYMVHNQDHVLSKTKIINHVWDGETLIMPNTVEVYIGYLRKKIDKNFPTKPPVIHTIHGFGYKIG